ncbi:hypothetical protein [Labedaea rhizosphaerae]|uniref:Uncharacterized protein n=1 Tax=Labedaea rhizosphaerae TaxID=598644 RepID=A0A4R6SHJ5_LABRH|nr:hypothetical protein [Labedaea rhizosphaerae]TDQ00329.1 hypothetical protein EV186_102190 [Labedaea rhizosphaerae]
MTRHREPEPIRPNLWADRLPSYAFLVEAAIGRNPMRYVMARWFDQEDPKRARTVLFVLKPDVLFGTYVRIAEDVVAGEVSAHTFLPTMAKPMRVADVMLFDCLPLTDVGYVDLMAWPHPLRDNENDDGTGRTYRFGGHDDLPSIVVTEQVDAGHAMVTARRVHRDGICTRTWEITEHGAAADGNLPLGIRVARPQTGHVTDFRRATAPLPVPGEVFDLEAQPMREWLVARLA